MLENLCYQSNSKKVTCSKQRLKYFTISVNITAVPIRSMTYENAENETRKKCRNGKLRITPNCRKLLRAFRSKCRKSCLLHFEIFLKVIHVKNIDLFMNWQKS